MKVYEYDLPLLRKLEQQHGKLNLINRLNLNLGNVICLCLKGEKKPKG